MKWYFVSFLLIVSIIIWNVGRTNEYLEVTFLDVGQGDAIFIEAPNGNQLLIDGGSNKLVLRELGKVMSFFDRSIDVIIATHPDKDHIGGLPHVLDRYEVDYFLNSGAISNTGVYKELQNKIDPILARKGMKIYLSSDIYVEILFPDRDVSKVDSNLASVIARVVYGNTSFLLTGDSPKSIEKYIGGVKSNVLKIGHHGSRTSTDPNFLEKVDPEFAVISAGKDNRYGHPHKDVMDLLANVSVFATYDEGNITFFSDGEKVWAD